MNIVQILFRVFTNIHAVNIRIDLKVNGRIVNLLRVVLISRLSHLASFARLKEVVVLNMALLRRDLRNLSWQRGLLPGNGWVFCSHFIQYFYLISTCVVLIT